MVYQRKNDHLTTTNIPDFELFFVKRSDHEMALI
jgi:hypothetical protein